MTKQSFELLLCYRHSQLVTAVHHKHHCLHTPTRAHIHTQMKMVYGVLVYLYIVYT